ncbi:hypothetical protein NFI96_001973 [Prochilodus magdalenae]|nr:hypothetical protein NFI96_001973 [Prochilodus magdalenae]
MTAHHLKLNPIKTEMLFIPSTTGPHCDLAISFGNSLIAPTEDAGSLGVILAGQISFSTHIANLTRSCRFLLYNIRRIRPFLSQEATQLLVQSLVISRLDYCNSLLAGLPLRAVRPLQLVQNAAARLIFNLPKFTHVTPLLRSLHWLPVVARIRFKTLMLAYKAKNGPAPPYLMAMVKSRSVPRALRASSTARLEPPSLRTHGRQASRLFSVLAPKWWNELPLGVRTAESLAVFKRRLKTHLFIKHLSTSTGPLFGQCLSSWTSLSSEEDTVAYLSEPLDIKGLEETLASYWDQDSEVSQILGIAGACHLLFIATNSYGRHRAVTGDEKLGLGFKRRDKAREQKEEERERDGDRDGEREGVLFDVECWLFNLQCLCNLLCFVFIRTSSQYVYASVNIAKRAPPTSASLAQSIVYTRCRLSVLPEAKAVQLYCLLSGGGKLSISPIASLSALTLQTLINSNARIV